MSRLGITSITQNPFKQSWKEGKAALGSWLMLASPIAAESMAALGWDFLVVDIEHSLVGFETMVSCFRAIQLGGAVPMARVPWNDTIWIQRSLDAGALGVIVPMVNNAEDARTAVANTKFAVQGIRSYGGCRIDPYVKGSYLEWADANLTVMVMIETIEAVRNADEILAVDGVDGMFIGPTDLALSMNLKAQDLGCEAHEKAIQTALKAAQNAGKIAGKFCMSQDDAIARVKQGFQLLTVGTDAFYLASAARAALTNVRSMK